MALIWAEFAERPVLEQYRNLKDHADRVGQWSLWREKAIGFLRETIVGKRDASKSRRTWQHPGHSDLVAILLWEKDVDAAWREAKEGGCSNELWLKLAAKREKDHPDEALPVYQSQVEPTLNRKNNEAYQEVVGLLQKTPASAGNPSSCDTSSPSALRTNRSAISSSSSTEPIGLKNDPFLHRRSRNGGTFGVPLRRRTRGQQRAGS